jgi:hypothetical protein
MILARRLVWMLWLISYGWPTNRPLFFPFRVHFMMHHKAGVADDEDTRVGCCHKSWSTDWFCANAIQVWREG